MRTRFLWFGCLLACLSWQAAADLIYKGTLQSNGSPANGRFDLRFSIHSSLTAAESLHSEEVLATGVTNGIFQVTLNPSADSLTPPELWLEIKVRAAGAGGYTTLTPRQKLSSVPRAIVADVAGSVAPGAVNATSFSSNLLGSGLLSQEGRIAVSYEGSGAAQTAARSDHNHLGSNWEGPAAVGLRLSLTNLDAKGIVVYSTNGTAATAINAISPNGYAVLAQSGLGTAVYAYSDAVALLGQTVGGRLFEGYGPNGLVASIDHEGNISSLGQFRGDGSALTNISASQITSGKLSLDQIPDEIINATSVLQFGLSLSGNNPQAGFSTINEGVGPAADFLSTGGKGIVARGDIAGIEARSSAGDGISAITESGVGLKVSSASGDLIRADNNTDNVFLVDNSGNVSGREFNGSKFSAQNPDRAAILGESAFNFGVAGVTTEGTGVFGSNNNSDDTGHAAYFEGRTRVTQSFTADGNITTHGRFIGNGSGITGLDASQFTSGIIPRERLPDELFTGGGSGGSGNAEFGLYLFGTNSQPGLQVINRATDRGSGILGQTQADQTGGLNYAGVQGANTSSDPFKNGFGVIGTTSTGRGAGVGGFSSGEEGAGVLGYTSSAFGDGVKGVHVNGVGSGAGIKGETASSHNLAKGVYGVATAPSGGTYGVYGSSQSTIGVGVHGEGSVGVSGRSQAGVGMRAESLQGTGVEATAGGDGVRATGNRSGVSGTSGAGFGVAGTTTSGTGVYGSNGGSDTQGHAGYFDGRVRVTKNLAVDGELKINKSIQVPGVGINSFTPVFQVVATEAMLRYPCSTEIAYLHHTNYSEPNGMFRILELDNPMINGNSNAVLIVTPLGAWVGEPYSGNRADLSVVFNPDRGRWNILSEGYYEIVQGRFYGFESATRVTRVFTGIFPGAKFNVLVFNGNNTSLP